MIALGPPHCADPDMKLPYEWKGSYFVGEKALKYARDASATKNNYDRIRADHVMAHLRPGEHKCKVVDQPGILFLLPGDHTTGYAYLVNDNGIEEARADLNRALAHMQGEG